MGRGFDSLRWLHVKDPGEVPERSKGADCKSAGSAFGGSNPPLSTTDFRARYRGGKGAGCLADEDRHRAGIAQLARASAFQAEGRGFESRFPLQGHSFALRFEGESIEVQSFIVFRFGPT